MPWPSSFLNSDISFEMVITRLFAGGVVRGALCMKCPVLGMQRAHLQNSQSWTIAEGARPMAAPWWNVSGIAHTQWSGFKLSLWKCHIFFSSFKYTGSDKSSRSRNHWPNEYSNHFLSGFLQRWLLVSHYRVAHYILAHRVVQCF